MADATLKPQQPYRLESVDNALRLILLVRERRVLRLSDAAIELDVAPSTAHRLLSTLLHRGFVRQDPATKAYLPGPVLTPLTELTGEGLDLATRAQPLLRGITEEAGETAHLCMLSGRQTVFLASIESERPLRTGSRAGLSLPAHCTSAGKAMLAQLSGEELRRRYGRTELETMTEQSLSSFDQLERALTVVARAGYATNTAESEPEILAVGVAMQPMEGVPHVAFAVSAPMSRIQSEGIPVLATILSEAAVALHGELAGLLAQ